MTTDWLLLVLCSLLIGVGVMFMRAGHRRGSTSWGLSLFVGLAPCIVSAPLAWRHLALFTWPYALLMMLGGVLGIGGIWALAEALRRGPTGPTFVIRSFSILVPVTASVLFYGEPLGLLRGLGLAGAAAAIPLLQGAARQAADPRSPHHAGAGWFFYAALSLTVFGGADLIFRDAAGRPDASNEFLLGVVLLGFLGNLVGVALGLALSRQRPNRADALWGSATGLVNLVAFILTLIVIRSMGGVLTFPARSIIAIATVVLLAALVFKERPTARAAAGLALGAAGIVLLAMK